MRRDRSGNSAVVYAAGKRARRVREWAGPLYPISRPWRAAECCAMFKNCCGCGKLKKVSDSSVEVEKEPDDTKDKDSIDEEKKNVQDEGIKNKPEQEKQHEDVQEKKTEVVSSAAKNPGLVVDTTSTVVISKGDDEEDDDNEVFPITPRTASMATPHPSKRNSTPGLASIPRWLSQEDDDDPPPEGGGTAEPPVTPVGRDELALRRHRFFSDLLVAAQAATEHRVRFDPLGPSVAGESYLFLINFF